MLEQRTHTIGPEIQLEQQQEDKCILLSIPEAQQPTTEIRTNLNTAQTEDRNLPLKIEMKSEQIFMADEPAIKIKQL